MLHTIKHKNPASKRQVFPTYSMLFGAPPRREDLFWLRHHLTTMREGTMMGQNPYVYIMGSLEPTKLRTLIIDLNPDGESLWPIRLTTAIRATQSRAVLRKIASRLHSILKEYH